MKDFTKKMMLITAAVLGITSLMYFVVNQYFYPVYYLVVLYFVLSTSIVCRWVYKLIDKDVRKFSSMFLLITFGQMVLHIVVLFVSLFLVGAEVKVKTFAIYFMVMYLIYTIFGILSMVDWVRKAGNE